MSPRHPSRRARAALSALLCLGLLAACGSRVDDEEIVASQSGGTVRLSPESLEALRGASAPQAQAQDAPEQAAAQTSVASPDTAAPLPGAERGRKTSKAGREIGTAISAPRSVATEGTPTTRVGAAEKCATSLDTIKLGHVGTFSGVAGPITASAVPTMAAWAKDVNSRGGLACHPVQVFTRDDGADPAKAAALANDLVKREGVVAFVGTISLMPAGFIQAVE